jgi:hypothetical protein
MGQLDLPGVPVAAGLDDAVLEAGFLDPGAEDVGVKGLPRLEADANVLDQLVEKRDGPLQVGGGPLGQDGPVISAFDAGGQKKADPFEIQGGEVFGVPSDFGAQGALAGKLP